MQELKKFYEEVSKDENLKERLESMVENRMAEVRQDIIKDYISIAKENGFEISEEDFSDNVTAQQLGASGGCLLIDSGCFVCGEINKHGGCIIIGAR